MKLKDILPKIVTKPRTNRDKARRLAAMMKAKAKENNPGVDANSTNPSVPLALGADSKQSY